MLTHDKIHHKVIALCVSAVIISSCGVGTNFENKPAGDTIVKTHVPQGTKQKSFIDSVADQDSLGITQVKRYSPLANIYPFNGKLSLKGDTIWYRNGERPLVIIDATDETVCSWKHLLVFNKQGKCTDNLTIESDCDEDYSSDFIRKSYNVSGATSFSTTETFIHRKEGQRDKVTVTQQFYRINNNGKIIALKKKVKKFTQPENSEDI